MCWLVDQWYQCSFFLCDRSEIRNKVKLPLELDKKKSQQAERWQHNNATNQPLQTHQHWSTCHKHTNTDIKAAGLCLQQYIWQAVYDTPSLVQLDCYFLALLHICIHIEVVYLHAISYPLSGPHAGFVFLMTSGALQDQFRSFLQTLIWAIHRQPWHLVQDVLYRDKDKGQSSPESKCTYTLCVSGNLLKTQF